MGIIIPVCIALILVALVAAPSDADTSSPQGPQNLSGMPWQLVKFRTNNDTILTPDDKAKYTITFEDPRSVRIDCNRGKGSWKSEEPSRLEFGPLALTRMMCPPKTLDDRFTKDWSYIRSYIIKDGHLFLALKADGGTYEFDPLGNTK
jgi:para-nitrobenzyl esterase